MSPLTSQNGGQFDEPVQGTAELAAHDCLDALRTGDVGRLAISATPWPEVFPINYVVDHGTVIFRTAPGTKLFALADARDVTFEADGFDGISREAWSVVIKGRAVEIESLHDRFDAAELPLFPWHAGPKHHFVRIEPVIITGRRFRAAPSTLVARLRPSPRRAPSE